MPAVARGAQSFVIGMVLAAALSACQEDRTGSFNAPLITDPSDGGEVVVQGLWDPDLPPESVDRLCELTTSFAEQYGEEFESAASDESPYEEPAESAVQAAVRLGNELLASDLAKTAGPLILTWADTLSRLGTDVDDRDSIAFAGEMADDLVFECQVR